MAARSPAGRAAAGPRSGIGRRLLALLLGVIALLLLVELGLAAGYRAFVWVQMRDNLATLGDEQGEIRILAVGESTTAVAGDELGHMLVPRTAYPVALERILNERQDQVRFRVLNNGIMGGTSSEVLDLLDRTLPELKPDVMIVMMGIKDTPDERMPGLSGLPDWLAGLRTVQLWTWLQESRQLRRTATVTDIRRFEDLPEVQQQRAGGLQNHVKELRMAGDSAGYDQAKVIMYLWYVGRLDQAEVVARQLVDERQVGWSLLGQLVHNAGRREEGRAIMAEAMARYPTEGMYPAVLAELLLADGLPDQAQAVLDQALARVDGFDQPEVIASYLRVVQAELLLSLGEHQRAAEVAADIEPLNNPRLRLSVPNLPLLKNSLLGRAAMASGDWAEAEQRLLSALQVQPHMHVNMWLLSQVYRETGQTDKEEQVRRELLENTGRMAEYFELAKLFRLTGHAERVPEVLDQAVAHIPSLRRNYARLYEIAEREGIRVVVMQYPSFPIEAARAYAPPAPFVSYIDNEDLFAADPERYFFEPTFPQSFTHYTQEGAELLAEHVADHILALYRDSGSP